MPRRLRVLTMTLVLFAIPAMDARGQRLLEVDGVELRGNSQLVMSGGGTCNVLESDTSYEDRKKNHGAPMDIWRLDFSVRNGSGRWLDHLIATFPLTRFGRTAPTGMYLMQPDSHHASIGPTRVPTFRRAAATW